MAYCVRLTAYVCPLKWSLLFTGVVLISHVHFLGIGIARMTCFIKIIGYGYSIAIIKKHFFFKPLEPGWVNMYCRVFIYFIYFFLW